MRPVLFTCLALAAAMPLAAQSTRAAQSAVATITEADVRRRIGIIAHDSMGGRDTPSRGLDLTAQYVADEFRRFGLQPGGDGGTFLQHYSITKWQMDTAGSSVTFSAGNTTSTASFASAARLAGGTVPTGSINAPVLLIAGKPDPKSLATAPIKGRMVVLALPSGTTLDRESQAAIAAGNPAAVISLAGGDSAAYAERVRSRLRPRIESSGDAPRPLAVEVHEAAVRPALTASGIDLDASRGSATPIVREVSGLTGGVTIKETKLSELTAPNTVGILRGSDPKLRDEYVVFSAHMDHVGISANGRCTAMGADSICNGADDDASGTIGVVELAEAFSRKGVKPKRSIIFLTVSGEEGGLRGSRYYSEHPSVPIEQIVADVNIDMIGRNWPDTIVAIGREHSDLGTTLDRVAAAHPELKMAVIDDKWPQERFYFRSDHYNFARKGVPIIFFFNGVHDDYHKPSDDPAKIDAEKESRIVKMLFWLGLEIANAPARPKWNEASYKDIVASAR
ncbi:MAG: M20/M25/M40 family metallo-hydrolase [Gemmatimonadales bacterium]